GTGPAIEPIALRCVIAQALLAERAELVERSRLTGEREWDVAFRGRDVTRTTGRQRRALQPFGRVQGFRDGGLTPGAGERSVDGVARARPCPKRAGFAHVTAVVPGQA